jgi:DNA mismatch endonuclease (patch repair protein)
MAAKRIAASSEAALRRMESQARRDTAPEIALRHHLHALGLRYRIDRKIEGVSSRPDLVFVRARVAIYVDGCFWHRCPLHGTVPASNRAWWRRKLEENVDRDRRVSSGLKKLGWRVIRVWEHEDPGRAARRIAEIIRVCRARRSKASIPDRRCRSASREA